MRIHNFFYLIKQGVKSVFKNRLMSFSCIGVLVACMLLIGASVMFTMTVNNLVTDVEQTNQFVAYLEPTASDTEMQQKLNKIPNIIEVKFIPKEEALESMKDKIGDSADSFLGLEGRENPLPDKYVLRIADSSLMEQTVAEVKAIKGVEKVNASLDVATILAGIKKTVYYAGVGIIAILIVVSLAIITNTIKITVFSRRREINIMKYVGATDIFIRLPFLIEGLIIGILAAVIAFLIMSIGYPRLMEWANLNYGSMLGIIFDNAASFDEVATKLLGGFSLIGVVIGLLSSTVFVRKHLRV